MRKPGDEGVHGSEEVMRAGAVYRALSRSTSDGLYVFRGMVCIDCNDKAAEILGWPIDQIIGSPPWDLSPPTQPDGSDSRALAERLMGRAREGESLAFDWVHSRSDGSLVHVEVGLHAVESEDEPLVVALLRDVSAKKLAEEALRDSERKFSGAFHASPDAIAIIAFDDLRLIEVNEAFESLSGYARSEVIGNNTLDLGLWRSPEQRSELVRRVRSGERIRDFQWEYRSRSGHEGVCELGVQELELAGESVALIVARDVSDRIRAQRSHRLLEEKFTKAFHASPDAMLLGSHATGTEEVNDRFLQMFEYTRGEVIGRTTVELGLWKSPEEHAKVRERLARRESVREREVSLLTKSGKVRTCLFSTEPIDIDEASIGLVIVRDITDQKRVQQERQKAFEEIARLKDELEKERDYLREQVDVSLRFGEIVGGSAGLAGVLSQVDAVAGTNANVLITGETGVGKELITRAIHSKSQRAARPLVKVNCSSVPRELFESEFFGHVKGSFTGAHRDRVGRFELADGGTLFLDEVAEIPMELQPKLLRVLQEGEFERVGEEATRRVDIRLIAATNRDLKVEAQEGGFRSDLYYRLSVFPISVPPLRERGNDVVALAQHFIRLASRELGRPPIAISRAQADALRAYEWPGNIRELRNVVERAVILSTGNRLRLDLALPEAMLTTDDHVDGGEVAHRERHFLTTEEFRTLERRNLEKALDQAGWKVSGAGGAAELLGLKPSTLAYRMKRLGIAKPS